MRVSGFNNIAIGNYVIKTFPTLVTITMGLALRIFKIMQFLPFQNQALLRDQNNTSETNDSAISVTLLQTPRASKEVKKKAKLNKDPNPSNRSVDRQLDMYETTTPIGDKHNEPPLISSTSSLESIEPQTTYLQILEGNKYFFVGAETPKTILDSGIKQVKEILKIQDKSFYVAAQSHTTFVPPSEKIPVDADVGERANIECDIMYSAFSVSRRSNVCLLGTSEQYRKASEKLAKTFNAKANSRPIHSKLGMIAEKVTRKLLKDPKKYALEKKIDGLFYRKLTIPLKIKAQTNPIGRLPLEQKILKVRWGKITKKPRVDEKKREAFVERVKKVKAEQEKIIREGSKYRFINVINGEPRKEKICFDEKQLLLATKGDSTIGRVPLNFSTRTNGIQKWKAFKQEVRDIFNKHGIDDVHVQMIGSTIHGFRRNPEKPMIPWLKESDTDLAIFSRTLSEQCIELRFTVNDDIRSFDGKRSIFKNKVSVYEKGFFNIPVGSDIKQLMEKWSRELYGEHAWATDVDFKMNIDVKPFRNAIDVVKM